VVGGGLLVALYLLVDSTTSRAADRPRGTESLTPPAEVAATPAPAVELIAPDASPEEPDTPPDAAPDTAAGALDPQPFTAAAVPLPLDQGRALMPAIAEAAAAPPRVPPGPPLQYSKSESGSRETINPGRLRIDQFKKQQAKQGPDRVEPTLKKQRRAKRAGAGGSGSTSGG